VSIITEFVAPTKFLFQPGDDKKSVVANREIKVCETISICEPEQRLWKLSTPAASPRLAIIELFSLVLFLVLALVGIVSCFPELSHLLRSAALGRVAARAINGGA
jgi:hypothetical protein